MASNTHCGTCRNHIFVGLENACRAHLQNGKPRIIPRRLWDKKRENGSNICSCAKWKDADEKTSVNFEGEKPASRFNSGRI